MRGQTARSRAGEKDVPGEGYGGEAAPEQAWRMLSEDPDAVLDAVLVDVRTQPEWVFVGVPDLSSLNKRVVFVPWQFFPNMRPNPEFASQLEAAGVEREGPLDGRKRRGSTGGWGVAGLPWIQD